MSSRIVTLCCYCCVDHVGLHGLSYMRRLTKEERRYLTADACRRSGRKLRPRHQSHSPLKRDPYMMESTGSTWTVTANWIILCYALVIHLKTGYSFGSTVFDRQLMSVTFTTSTWHMCFLQLAAMFIPLKQASPSFSNPDTSSPYP